MDWKIFENTNRHYEEHLSSPNLLFLNWIRRLFNWHSEASSHYWLSRITSLQITISKLTELNEQLKVSKGFWGPSFPLHSATSCARAPPPVPLPPPLLHCLCLLYTLSFPSPMLSLNFSFSWHFSPLPPPLNLSEPASKIVFRAPR